MVGRDWNLKIALGLAVLAAVLGASFLTDAGWRELDIAVWRGISTTMADAPGWAVMLAGWTGTRLFDGALGVILIAASLVGVRDRVAPVLTFWGVMVGAVLYSKTGYWHVWRDSPSLVAPGFSPDVALFGFAPKLASLRAFPGDHAVIVFVYLAGALTLLRSPWTLAAAGLGVASVLPRLVAGAHWLSDVVVGGGVIACGFALILLATPLVGWVETVILPRVTGLVHWRSG